MNGSNDQSRCCCFRRIACSDPLDRLLSHIAGRETDFREALLRRTPESVLRNGDAGHLDLKARLVEGIISPQPAQRSPENTAPLDSIFGWLVFNVVF
jgi:hypothetical protein